MPHFEYEDIRFYYEQSGSGTDFLFSHGLGGSTARVLELTQGLPSVRVTLYDNRGHGRTLPLQAPEVLNFKRMAADAVRLLDFLGIQQVIGGGVSMGAGVALRLALDFPDRVRGLVLSRPAWLDRPEPVNLTFATILAGPLAAWGPEKAIAILEATDYYRALKQGDSWAALLLREIIYMNDPVALAACYAGMVASAPMDSVEELSNISVPALVIGCNKDSFHPIEIAHTWAKHLPNAQFVEISPQALDEKEHVRQFRVATARFLYALA